LKNLEIKIGLNSFIKLTKTDYLKSLEKSIYYQKVKFVGRYLVYKPESDSFEIKVNENTKYYCHLNK